MNSYSIYLSEISSSKCLRWCWCLLLLAANASAQYNDSRTLMILPNSTVTQRPGEARVNADVREFCRDQDYFFISSSAKGRTVQHDYSAYMQFNLTAIPQGAVVDSVTLVIYLNKVKNASTVFEQTVNLYELGNARGNQIIDIKDSASIAMSKVSKQAVGQPVSLQAEVENGASWVAERKGQLFCVLAAEEAETFRYYSDRSGNRSKQPKLVIQYHMPVNRQGTASWLQYKYNAQHTAMLSWQSNATTTGFRLQPLFPEPGPHYIKSDPLVNNNRIVLYYQTANYPMHRLVSLSQQGRILASTERYNLGLVAYGPVADRKGNIYCITENSANTLVVTDPAQLQVVYKKELEEQAQALAAPVIGFDGSLYVSTNRGVYAYTPQPECKLKWVHAASGFNKWGMGALDETEQTLFVYDGIKGCVTALNCMDGAARWSVGNLGSFAEDIPVPVVKNGRVCITNGLRKGKIFMLLDAAGGQQLQMLRTGEAVLSQAVMGTDRAFIVNGGQLESYALADGSRIKTTSGAAFNPAGALAADADNNVYLLNPEKGKQSLTLVAAGTDPGPVVAIDDAMGYLAGNRLVLQADGSLLAGNDNHLYAVKPTGYSVKEDISIPFNNAAGFRNEFLYRSEGRINVAAKPVTANQAVVIQGGKGISFQAGFTVQNGASLRCDTGL